MNPKKLSKRDNAAQEPWKLPLPAFIEYLYRKRFGKDRPDRVHSVEDRARLLEQEEAARREKSGYGEKQHDEGLSRVRNQ